MPKTSFLTLLVVVSFMFTGCSDSGGTNGGEDANNQADGNNDDGDGGLPGDIIKTDGGQFADDFVECVGLNELATNTRGPADVIIAIDNTPSMYNEIEEVRANMNRFSEMVEQENLDLHIALISCLLDDCLQSDNWHTICIDPPVGAVDACNEAGNTDDSQPPEYLHVNSKVESRKGLESIIDTYDQWSSILRDNAAKHVVMVSDDNDDWTMEQFNTALLAADSRFAGYQFSGIFSYLSKEDACAISDEEPCCTYSAPGGEGVVYKELVAATNGVSGDMCLQDFDPVFDELAAAVVASARLNCEWVIPEPPEGEELQANLVNVIYSDGSGQGFMFGYVETLDNCTDVEHGWYYDNPDTPTIIYICPQTCDWIQGQVGAQITVQFGCETQWVPET